MIGTLKQQNSNQQQHDLLCNLRFACIALQTWQALIGNEPTVPDPSLADLGTLIIHLQGIFGEYASVEDVIQSLVVVHTEHQLIARHLQQEREVMSQPSIETILVYYTEEASAS